MVNFSQIFRCFHSPEKTSVGVTHTFSQQTATGVVSHGSTCITGNFFAEKLDTNFETIEIS